MDLKINFRVKFSSRYTYPEVCATKNCEKNDLCCENLASASPIYVRPIQYLGLHVEWVGVCVWAIS